MARLNPSPIRMYRGTTAQHSQYAGPIGELTVDTDKNTVVVQNGTDGGVPLAQERRQVIAGDGITVNGGASGTLASDITLAVDQTWLNNRITDKVKGDATLITGGDGIDTTLTDTGTQVSVDSEWLSDQITEQVRTDTGLIQAGNGITISVTDNGKTVSANAGTGIVADTNGISVNEEWLAQQVTDKVKEDTSLVTAGNGVSVTPTGTGVQVAVVGSDSVDSAAGSVSVNEEWLAGKVTEQVRTDANLVVAGNGLTEVVGEDGKTLSVNPGAGISVTGDAVTVDTAWLTEQLDTRVESGGFVTAGDGIDVTASEGKAEIAVDDTVVRTANNQEINGSKTFRALTHFYGVQLHDSNKIDIVLDFNRGVSPSYLTYSGFTVDSLDKKNLGYCRVGVETDGVVAASLAALQNISGTAGLALISVRYPQTGSPYAIAPSTRATPEDTEIITFDFLKNYVTEHADNSVYLPLYFQVGTTEEIHTFLPAGVTTVRRANFEADGAGTGSLTLTMTRDIGATTSMTVGSSATDCSAYAGHAVMFTISGTSDQTEVAAMLVFE